MTTRIIVCVEEAVAIGVLQSLCRAAGAEIDADTLPKVRGGDWRGADRKTWRFVDPADGGFGLLPSDRLPFWTNVLETIRSEAGFAGLLHHHYRGRFAAEIVEVRTVISVSGREEIEDRLRRLEPDALLATSGV